MINEQRIVWLTAFALGGMAMYLLAPVLTPFVASALLAYLGDPLADRLQKLKLPRPVAVLFVFLLTILVMFLLVLLLLPLVETQVTALLEVLPRYIQYLEAKVWPHVASFVGQGVDGSEIGLAAMVERFGASAGSWGSTLLASVGRSGGALITAVVNLFLIPILTFYLLRDWDVIVARLATLVPSAKRDVVFDVVRQTDETLGAFLRGQLLVMLGLGVIYSVGLWLAGLELALLIGMLSGLLSFVPYLGFIVGFGAAAVAVLLQTQDLLALLPIVLVFGVGQMLEGFVLTPWLVGDRIGLHPVSVIFSVLAGGQLFGFVGILLGLPVAAVIAVLVRHAHVRYRASQWYGTAEEVSDGNGNGAD